MERPRPRRACLIPDLRFSVQGVYAGLDVIVINYRNQRGNLVSEVLRFDGDEVVEGHGTYLTESLGDPVGAVGAGWSKASSRSILTAPGWQPGRSLFHCAPVSLRDGPGVCSRSTRRPDLGRASRFEVLMPGLPIHHLNGAHITAMSTAGLPLACHVLLVETPAALHQVRALGFEPQDVRHIVSTHLVLDHADELTAAMRRKGAKARGRYRPPCGLTDPTSPATPRVAANPGSGSTPRALSPGCPTRSCSSPPGTYPRPLRRRDRHRRRVAARCR